MDVDHSFSAGLEQEIRAGFVNPVNPVALSILATDVTDEAKEGRRFILAEDHAIGSTAQLSMGFQGSHEGMCISPRIRLDFLEGEIIHGRSLEPGESGSSGNNSSHLFPCLAVVVLPDDVGQGCSRGSRDWNSVDPHPVISESVAIENGVIDRNSTHNDHIPRRVPHYVQRIRNIHGNAIEIITC